MTPFYKLSGAGNDFIALPEAVEPPAPERIRAWCSRGLSLGADGLFLLRPEGAGTVRMTYFNADGERATLCLNGTRCAARLAFELEWSDGSAAGEDARVTVLTDAGALRTRRLGPDEVSLELPEELTLDERAPASRAPEVDGRAWRGIFVDAGVPHFVLPWPEDLAAAPVETLGRALRRHPDFAPAGTNVDFVHTAGRHRLAIRSFERGVEAETLACGTGVLAAVAAGLGAGEVELPVTARTRSGFELTVDSAESGAWTLAGDARLVARGELLPGAG